MKGLLKILAWGFAVFMVLSIAQEWEYFSTSWFGAKAERKTLSDGEKNDAAAAVNMTLTLMRHFYSSNGDTRFADRIPAAEGIIDEMAADVGYLARNHRTQDAELIRLEITTVEELGPERVEVRTREQWRVELLWAVGGGEAEPPILQTIHGKYLVVRGNRGWRVEGWDMADPPEKAETPSP